MRASSQFVLFGFALLFLFYWFRRRCGNILRARIFRERAEQVAAANQLQFAHICNSVDTVPLEELDVINAVLLREYGVLMCLLRYTSAVQRRGFTFAQILLMLDFHMLSRWYRLTRRHFSGQARATLLERADILAFFASAMGERTAALLRA